MPAVPGRTADAIIANPSQPCRLCCVISHMHLRGLYTSTCGMETYACRLLRQQFLTRPLG